VIATLVADIGEFSAKMGEARVEMADTEGAAARTGALGKAGLLALAGGAIAVGAESIHMASEFDAAMARINTQDNAGLSIQQMKDLRNAVLNLAGPTAQAPDALAEAMIHVYGSGLKGAQALDVLRTAAEGATVGHANLTDVTNALDAAIAVNIPGVQNYQQAMGELNATVGAGDMTMQNLAEALGGPMLATVKGYGLNITDVGAALATFGDRNIRGSEAATELRMAVQALAVPAASGGKALESIGLATNTLQKDMQQGGLKQALNDLNEHLLKAGYNSQTAGTLITEAFGKKAGGGLNVLMDSLSSSTSNFNEKFKAVSESGKNFGQDWAQTQDTLAFKIKSMEAAAEALGIKIGNVLIPAVTHLLGWLSDLAKAVGNVVNWFKQHHDAAMALGVVVGGFLLYAVYTATVALWEMASAVIAATWPFLAIAAAIAGVTYGVIYAYEHWAWFRTVVRDVGDVFVWLWNKILWFVDNFGSIWHSATQPFVDAWNDAYASTVSTWDDITSFVSGVWGGLVDLWNSTGGQAVTAISNTWDSVSASVSSEWDYIYGDLQSIWNNLTELWNDSGGKLVTLISNNMDHIRNVVRQGWDWVVGNVRGILEIVEGVVQGGWDTVKGLVQLAWDQIYGIVKTAWDLISGLVSGSLDFIGGLLQAGWDGITGTVQIAWDLIKGFINTPLDFIKGQVQIFTDFFTGKWGKLWGDVKNTASNIWNDISTMFSNILGTIEKTVTGAASSIWTGFITGIETATLGVWLALIDIWKTFINFFKDAINWLWKAGQDIVKGLVNGIESMGSAVWNAISGLGGGILGKLGGIFNFGSPSRTMHQYGTWIGQGLANGMAGQQVNAASAAQALARSALAGFGTPAMTATGTVSWSSQNLAAAGMNGGTAGGYSTPAGFSGGNAPTIQVYLDGNEVSGILRTKTLRYDMRNSGNGLALAGRGFQ
jgi:TP901 family phage tail tape measure protein